MELTCVIPWNILMTNKIGILAIFWWKQIDPGIKKRLNSIVKYGSLNIFYLLLLQLA